jgi:hypothetical protein
MLPEQNTMRLPKDPSGVEAFLRSINLIYDAESPERIAHFFPTSKSVALIRAILGLEDDRAFFAVAPYGSGKSLSAAYALNLIENRKESRTVLHVLNERLASVDEELAEYAQGRVQKELGGLVLPLLGHVPSLPAALKQAAFAAMKRVKLGREARSLYKNSITTMDEAISLLHWLQEKVREKGYNRIAILWDEFGRHVDSLVADGKATELVDIQSLAEFAARAKNPSITLNLFLHQGLMHYAADVPQIVRKEWTKIEGRFRNIQYIDDSKEIYSLIAQIISSLQPNTSISDRDYRYWAKKLLELGRFRGFETDELTELLQKAHPLEPLTLELLPRIAGRVAQNERTLFGFLYHNSLDRGITPADLYDYFSEAMRADTGVGGTYRHWLETESALAKIGDESMQRKALKTTCLLGLGASGERARAGHSLLVMAVAGYEHKWEEATEAVDWLIDQKLLLHRRHSDTVSVWHGTDADLRGKLEDEKESKRVQFDLQKFLNEELPPPAWRPVEYNDDYRIRRYFIGEYHTLKSIEPYIQEEISQDALPLDIDGKVLYILVESSKELAEAEAILKQSPTNPRLVFALPSESLQLTEAALEVWCLAHMQHDNELVGSDPLVLPELRQMSDDARTHLRKMAHRLLFPGHDGPRWFHQGQHMDVASLKKLRKYLSSIMRQIYPYTPCVNNELIVRKKPSRVIVNARKKLTMGILERSGQPDLGMQGTTPDASMFRTVLNHTGLYRTNEQTPRHAYPDELDDQGLRRVWSEFKSFFTEPAELPKSFERLFNTIKSPPYGVRNGLIPIFLASAFKTFPSAISLLKDGSYVEDILPSEIENIFQRPQSYSLYVLGIDEPKVEYLLQFYKIFTDQQADDGDRDDDLIRACYEAFQAWKSELPTAAFYSKRLSDEARGLQKAMQAKKQDPVQILFSDIPNIFAVDESSLKETLSDLQRTKEELEGVHVYLGRMAVDAIRKIIAPGRGHEADLIQLSQNWAKSIPHFVLAEIQDATIKALIIQMGRSYKSENILINAFSQILLGKPLKRWDDSTVYHFAKEFERSARKVEETMLEAADKIPQNSEAANKIASLMEDRVSTLIERLTLLLGREKTEEILLAQVRQTEPENDNN